MNKYKRYIIFVFLCVLIYNLSGILLDKLYLRQYDIKDYMGKNRYDTVNMAIDKKYKKSDEALLINVSRIDDMLSLANYAYQKDIPAFYSESDKLDASTIKEMKKLKIKYIKIVGGETYISNSIENELNRNDIKTDRLIVKSGVDMSMKSFELTNQIKKIDSIFIVSKDVFDLSNGISFLPYSLNNNILSIPTDNTIEDYAKINKFISDNKVKKVFIISDGKINSNLMSSLGKCVTITGKDRYDINKKIIDRFYSNNNNSEVYLSQCGKILHRRNLDKGQLINAIAAAPLAADSKVPIMYLNKVYIDKDEDKIIKEKKYKKIHTMGFRLERRKFFNVERFAIPTTVFLIIISIFIAFKVSKNIVKFR